MPSKSPVHDRMSRLGRCRLSCGRSQQPGRATPRRPSRRKSNTARATAVPPGSLSSSVALSLGTGSGSTAARSDTLQRLRRFVPLIRGDSGHTESGPRPRRSASTGPFSAVSSSWPPRWPSHLCTSGPCCTSHRRAARARLDPLQSGLVAGNRGEGRPRRRRLRGPLLDPFGVAVGPDGVVRRRCRRGQRNPPYHAGGQRQHDRRRDRGIRRRRRRSRPLQHAVGTRGRRQGIALRRGYRESRHSPGGPDGTCHHGRGKRRGGLAGWVRRIGPVQRADRHRARRARDGCWSRTPTTIACGSSRPPAM